MTDSREAEHEPTFGSGGGDTVAAGGSVTKELDFGNLGGASAVSWHWECDACDAGEAIGRILVFVVMGGIYWFGMLILFIVWLVTRPPRVVQVVAESAPTPGAALGVRDEAGQTTASTAASAAPQGPIILRWSACARYSISVTRA